MFSKPSLDMLLDLVEIKLSTIMVVDKEDIKEVVRLKNCRSELYELINNCSRKRKKSQKQYTVNE